MNSHENNVNKLAWDAYQEDYMRFMLLRRKDYFDFFSGGGVELDSELLELVGDVRGLRILDTCCACDATQAFSWHNLGAIVTACDISSKALQIARKNAQKMNLEVEFVESDAQFLQSIGDEQFDIVYATYPVWLSDLGQACKTWRRILKKGGRLLLSFEHPITYCIEERNNSIHIIHNYNKKMSYYYDEFLGTPLAEEYGGWSVQMPSIEHFYRISDHINAVLLAPFTIVKVCETGRNYDGTPLSMLPQDFTILAQKGIL